MEYILIVIICASLIQGCQAKCAGSDCGSCISTGYDCAWCTEKDFTLERCQTKEMLIDVNCTDIESPEVSNDPEITKNEAVRDGDAISRTNPVQLQPQRVKVTTRPGSKHKLSMTFRAANNYPVDLYFLFDLSATMKSQIENLAELAMDIGDAIGDITTNYTMGYGVFQDKRAMPFTDTSSKKMANPCRQSGKEGAATCAAPFEFRHLLNLTKNVAEFSQRVTQSKQETTGNIDHPEGSADAILQSIACKREIGWRDEARKLLIYASDDRFHLAGDGRLAGIVTPNDGHCHLSQIGQYMTYDKELEQDYPSVGQLSNIAEENAVHIIFAVAGRSLFGAKLNRTIELYKQLSDRIPQSVVRNLKDPNESIKDIVEKKYKSMLSNVEITHNKVEGVEVNIQATSNACAIKGTNVCTGLEIGQSISFDIELEVLGCSSDRGPKTITIGPSFMQDQDKLVVELDVQCDCGCMGDNSTWEMNSDSCGGNGTLKCGMCYCHEGRRGAACQCDVDLQADDGTTGCQRPNTNGTECSGRGFCSCDQCFCDEGYSGGNCECVEGSCGISGGQVCGGPSHGRCDCGSCLCQSKYSGAACDCPTSNITCLDGGGEICNGNGECECGKCSCVTGYFGERCERSVLSDDICDFSVYKNCALCTFDSKNNQCPSDCPALDDRRLVATVGKDELGVCSVKLPDGCIMSYQVIPDENVVIKVQKGSECPEEMDVVGIVTGTVIGIVGFVLLLLLLLRICVWFYDKREYAKWEDDKKDAKWAQQDNPMYQGATTTYQNPLMDGAPTDHAPPMAN